MSAKDDVDDVATAFDLIEESGKTIKITPVPTGVYDPTTGGNIAGTGIAAFDRKAIVKDFNARTSNAVNISIENGDKEITLAAYGLDKPQLGWTFTIDSETFTVVPQKAGGLGVQTTYSGELAVLYKVHGRYS
jgi:hypothetical protein